ncbi:MAG TPA: DNA primase [Longimicrobiales bacterium]|nr:DNA primase [Longimicrobiales bacterium]
MIRDELVEEVRLRSDIVELVGEHVPLKRAGKDYRGLCPFHKEKTPSFYVVPAKGFYKCFGCGESGDIFSFLMQHVGLDFPAAVRAVADRVGVDIPDRDESARGPDPHAPLLEALSFAAEYYADRLADPSAGADARAYLERRGVDAPAVERFRIGYAPDAWRALREAARTHGIEDQVLLEAGLIKTSERSEEPFDRLRNRLVFPILDVRGRVIGFGGRALGVDDAPKYLNSPETPVYHKSRELYGLHWARTAIRRAGEALVVEGYMDFVALAAAGLEHAVAPLGTSLTGEQASLLARYTDRALLLYDSDAAGQRATFRSGDVLLAAGVHPLVVTLPPGEDPDSLVRTGGVDALTPYLRGAIDLLDRKIEILADHGLLEDIDGLRTAVDKLLPTLRAVRDPALRDLYVARVADRTGVRASTIDREIAGSSRSRERGAPPPPRPVPAPDASGPVRESTLVLLLMRDPRLRERARDAVEPALFRDPVLRELYAALLDMPGGGAEPDAQPASDSLDVPGPPDGLSAEARRQWAVLATDPQEVAHGDAMFADTVRDLRAEALNRELDEVMEAMRVAGLEGDDAKELELYRRRAALTARQQELLASPVERHYAKHRRRTR